MFHKKNHLEYVLQSLAHYNCRVKKNKDRFALLQRLFNLRAQNPLTAKFFYRQ